MNVAVILALGMLMLAGCSNESRYQLVAGPAMGYGPAILRLDTKTGDIDLLVLGSERDADRARAVQWHVVPAVRR